MPLFKPDRYFSRISSIDIRFDLIDQGFNAVLLDVDNTILSRSDHEVPHDVLLWLSKLKHSHVSACLLSNNFHSHVFDLADKLDLPIVAKALKPLPQGFLMACRKIRADRGYLVCPLVEEDLKHTVFVRNIERIVIADQEPEGARACETSPLSQRRIS